MPELSFRVTGASAATSSVAPLLQFALEIGNEPATEPIQSVLLRCQIQIEALRRRYEAGEQARLYDLFGEPERWSRTLRTMLWTHANLIVPPFTGRTTVELPVPCSFDFTVAATKYFAALEDGEVPLLFQFSGTVFHEVDDGALQVAPIPWDREVPFRLPVSTWNALMEQHYSNSAWLCLRRDAFDRLDAYKRERGLPTWEQAIESLLPEPTIERTVRI